MTSFANACDAFASFAEEYADAFAGELDGKPFDRDLLSRFAGEVAGRGRVWDVGCGPAGHIARYLADDGCDVAGVDVSPAVIGVARSRQPGLDFCVADMRELPVADGTLAGIVAFYSLHHLSRAQGPVALAEFRRVLARGGALLLSVHEGAGESGLAQWPGHPAGASVSRMTMPELADGLHAAGFIVRELHSREPYPAEYPARRLYVWAVASG